MMATLTNNELPLPCKQALRALKLVDLRTDGPDCDPWAGYPHERRSILQHIRDCGIDNVVVLSGDVHVALAAELSCEGPDETDGPIAVEFVTPSVTSQNLDDKMGWMPRTDSLSIEQGFQKALPHLRWCDLDSHGYVILDVSRERVVAEWWFVDSIRARSNYEVRGAAWTVESHRPRLMAH